MGWIKRRPTRFTIAGRLLGSGYQPTLPHRLVARLDTVPVLPKKPLRAQPLTTSGSADIGAFEQ